MLLPCRACITRRKHNPKIREGVSGSVIQLGLAGAVMMPHTDQAPQSVTPEQPTTGCSLSAHPMQGWVGERQGPRAQSLSRGAVPRARLGQRPVNPRRGVGQQGDNAAAEMCRTRHTTCDATSASAARENGPGQANPARGLVPTTTVHSVFPRQSAIVLWLADCMQPVRMPRVCVFYCPLKASNLIFGLHTPTRVGPPGCVAETKKKKKKI